MVLDHQVVEVLEALKAAELDDRIRTTAETIYQALTEVELSSVIGADVVIATFRTGVHSQSVPAVIRRQRPPERSADRSGTRAPRRERSARPARGDRGGRRRLQ